MSRLSRGALLLLLAASQAFASTGQLLHLCRMRDEPRACHCPHRQKAEGAEQKAAAAIEAAPCCERHVIEAASAPLTFEPQSLSAVALPPAVASALDLLSLAPLSAPRRHWRPPAHGPPLYLQLRTLLI